MWPQTPVFNIPNVQLLNQYIMYGLIANQIVHILIRCRWTSSILDRWVYPRAEIGLDNVLVRAKLNLRLTTRRNQTLLKWIKMKSLNDPLNQSWFKVTVMRSLPSSAQKVLLRNANVNSCSVALNAALLKWRIMSSGYQSYTRKIGFRKIHSKPYQKPKTRASWNRPTTNSFYDELQAFWRKNDMNAGQELRSSWNSTVTDKITSSSASTNKVSSYTTLQDSTGSLIVDKSTRWKKYFSNFLSTPQWSSQVVLTTMKAK